MLEKFLLLVQLSSNKILDKYQTDILQRDQRITETKANDTPGQSKGVFFTILMFVKDVLSLGNFQLVLSEKYLE
jgi:hypothetical protein